MSKSKEPSQEWKDKNASAKQETDKILSETIGSLFSKKSLKKNEEKQPPGQDWGVESDRGMITPRVESHPGLNNTLGIIRPGYDDTQGEIIPKSDNTGVESHLEYDRTGLDRTPGTIAPGLNDTPIYSIEVYKGCRNWAVLGILFLLWDMLPDGYGIVSLSQLAARTQMDVSNFRKKIRQLESAGFLIKDERGMEGTFLDLRTVQRGGAIVHPLMLSSSSYLINTTTTNSTDKVQSDPGAIAPQVQSHRGSITPGVESYPGLNQTGVKSDRGVITPSQSGFGESLRKRRLARSFFLAVFSVKKNPDEIAADFYKWLFSQKMEETFLVSLVIYTVKQADKPKLYADGMLKKGWEPSQKELVRAREIIDAGSVIDTRPRDIGVEITAKEWSSQAAKCGMDVGLNLEIIRKSASQIQERIRKFAEQF